MLVLVSPSKSIMQQMPPNGLKLTKPLFADQTEVLVNKMARLSPGKLKNVLGVSPKLAELNHQRFATWAEAEKRPALWMYSGDVYNGLDAFTLTDKQVNYAQGHLLVISGMYGLLRPLDAAQPYRLEMKTSLKIGRKNNLYEYWAESIQSQLEASGQKTLLLCASPEYAKAVPKMDGVQQITPRFMQETNAGLREKGLFAKYARGALARWVIDNQVNDPAQLKNYQGDGFKYSAEHSSDQQYVYIVPQGFSLKGRFVKK